MFLLPHGDSPIAFGSGAAVGYGRSSVYEWRLSDDAFVARCLRSIAIVVDLLEAEADRRGRDGTEEPDFFRGESVGPKRRYSDALLLPG